ncbi:MAG: DUF4342 domain-containing protein [Dehalococcoidia bacterium]|nr:DUF4342 domain-containing protein [Dehalococcoidia bacterium]
MAKEGSRLQEQVKSLWRAGMVRHVYIRKDGHTPVDLPLLLVLAGGLLAPWLLGIGVVVALLVGYRLDVEIVEDGEEPDGEADGEAADDLPRATLATPPGEDAIPPEATEGVEPRG